MKISQERARVYSFYELDSIAAEGLLSGNSVRYYCQVGIPYC